ncbi:baseplate hub domain-containing protein [Brevundimonas vesicularis]|uniref:baseplate hub domain-containing protein n=1 Tax=Brevundimonas vesicularis TaxID=41276 RepID=UPI0040388C60
MAARIESGAATLCHVWRLERADGVVMGFTDHDRDLVVDGVVCRAASGWTAGAGESAVGLAAGSVSAAGVLDDAAIAEADVAAGLFDAATVELWRVDWARPDLRVRLWSGALAKIQRQGSLSRYRPAGCLSAGGFVAELGGPFGEAGAGGRADLWADVRCATGRPEVPGRAAGGAGLRQAVGDLRRDVWEWVELSRISGCAGGRLPDSLSGRKCAKRRREPALSGSAVVMSARSWLGTPYRHQASMKGVGADCLGLVRGVWREVVGEEPEVLPAYSADWAEVGGRETLLEAAGRWMRPVAVDQMRAGDVLLFHMSPGAAVKHCAILSDLDGPEPRMIHAYWGRAVVESWMGVWWRRRLAAVFRFPVPGSALAACAASLTENDGV